MSSNPLFSGESGSYDSITYTHVHRATKAEERRIWRWMAPFACTALVACAWMSPSLYAVTLTVVLVLMWGIERKFQQDVVEEFAQALIGDEPNEARERMVMAASRVGKSLTAQMWATQMASSIQQNNALLAALKGNKKPFTGVKLIP